jgi:EAL domain-containing protein (putative c-di-GMP-specific phosphodiesterase class I)
MLMDGEFQTGASAAPRRPLKRPPRPGPLRVQHALPQALACGEISAAFQPKVSLDTGAIIGVEALARWTSPLLGMVAPEIFIPAAEATRLIGTLTRSVLHDALAACRRLRAVYPNLTMAVNISPILLSDPELASQIARALEKAGLSADALVIEITESHIIRHLDRAERTLRRLRAHGISCAIDDFGTGHASLLSLLRLPFNELKIDRAFVASCADDGEAEKIVRATIGLAREMRLNVVAEGIETARTEAALRELGCKTGQGFRYGPAMSEAMLLGELAA